MERVHVSLLAAAIVVTTTNFAAVSENHLSKGIIAPCNLTDLLKKHPDVVVELIPENHGKKEHISRKEKLIADSKDNSFFLAKEGTTFRSEQNIFGLDSPESQGLVSIFMTRDKLIGFFGGRVAFADYLRELTGLVNGLVENSFVRDLWNNLSQNEKASVSDSHLIGLLEKIRGRSNEEGVELAQDNLESFLDVPFAQLLGLMLKAGVTMQQKKAIGFDKDLASSDVSHFKTPQDAMHFLFRLNVVWRSRHMAQNILNAACKSAEAGKSLKVIFGAAHLPAIFSVLKKPSHPMSGLDNRLRIDAAAAKSLASQNVSIWEKYNKQDGDYFKALIAEIR